MKNLTPKITETTEFPDWKINNSTILELSQTFNIKYNVWINLGLTINKEYKLIENGKINPSNDLNNDISILRNNQLYGYYMYIVKQLSIIKYYTTVIQLPYEIKEMLVKNKVANLDEKLKINVKDIPIKYKYYVKTDKAFKVSNFLLYSISKILLDFYKNMKSIGMTMGNEIIKYIINEIIKMEKIYSKPDLNKFKSARISSTKLDESTDELNIDGDQIQNEYTDDPNEEKSLFDASDSEPDDEFSMNSMDIEQDEEENLSGNPMDF
jgi:hypothetical protein